MRYYFWFCINEILIYPMAVGLALAFHFIFKADPWFVAALAVSLCLVSSCLTQYLGKSLITLTAARASILASEDQLDKALNRLIYLSRLLPPARKEIRRRYTNRRTLDKVDLMELAVKCMRLDKYSCSTFFTAGRVLYAVALALSLLAVLFRLIR